jgi:hypothetical protein
VATLPLQYAHLDLLTLLLDISQLVVAHHLNISKEKNYPV